MGRCVVAASPLVMIYAKVQVSVAAAELSTARALRIGTGVGSSIPLIHLCGSRSDTTEHLHVLRRPKYPKKDKPSQPYAPAFCSRRLVRFWRAGERRLSNGRSNSKVRVFDGRRRTRAEQPGNQRAKRLSEPRDRPLSEPRTSPPVKGRRAPIARRRKIHRGARLTPEPV